MHLNAFINAFNLFTKQGRINSHLERLAYISANAHQRFTKVRFHGSQLALT